MFRFVPFIIVACLWFGCGGKSNHPTGVEEKGTYVIFDSLVRVTARYDTNAFAFNVLITCGADSFHSTTIPMVSLSDSAKYPETITMMKKTTAWKGDYFFVRSECGGGNAWNCDYDGVFRMRNGRLVLIGNISCSDDETPGGKYDGKYFRHLYDKFEMNDLTSHAGAPGLWLVMTEKDGKFVVNTEKTWEENLEQYRENDVEISAYKKGNANSDYETENLDKLLANAVAAKYCIKTDDLNRYLSYAQGRYDKQTYSLFSNIIRNVVSGEYISQ